MMMSALKGGKHGCQEEAGPVRSSDSSEDRAPPAQDLHPHDPPHARDAPNARRDGGRAGGADGRSRVRARPRADAQEGARGLASLIIPRPS